MTTPATTDGRCPTCRQRDSRPRERDAGDGSATSWYCNVPGCANHRDHATGGRAVTGESSGAGITASNEAPQSGRDDRGAGASPAPLADRDNTVMDADTQTMRCTVCGDELSIPLGSMLWVGIVLTAFANSHRGGPHQPGRTRLAIEPAAVLEAARLRRDLAIVQRHRDSDIAIHDRTMRLFQDAARDRDEARECVRILWQSADAYLPAMPADVVARLRAQLPPEAQG